MDENICKSESLDNCVVASPSGEIDFSRSPALRNELMRILDDNKPEKLIIDCIKAGCPEGEVVLDPFMGAATTALVARKLNRNYIGYELNEDYIEIAEKRLYKELGMYK